ncbi:YdjC-like protein [Laceyella sediminis]|uniref:YdjC-like protein n=1 Tax=Laceyella sediminis TaxID=573074 RepID=A0ABX5ENX7_9BACL|nr:ChbG/HpnK family deacetylase [Laceyella sediminis]PRZ12686.1 YdjC-like protein [Laceyella sediminis]
MKKLVVNADDVGIDWDRDIGIGIGVWFRAISSISVVVTNPASHSRIQRLARWIRKFRPRVSIGLHLNLTDEPFCTCTLESILEREIGFDHPKVAFWKSAIQQNINLSNISREISAQLQQFQRLFSFQPTHLDGHNHCHIAHPLIFQEICTQYNSHIRIPNESLLKENLQTLLSNLELEKDYFSCEGKQNPLLWAHTMRESPISDLLLYRYSSSLLSPISAKKFIGSIYGHIRTYSFLKKNLQQSFESTDILELMVHPGFYFPVPHSTWFSNKERLQELWNLVRLQRYLKKQHIKIVNQDGLEID